MPDLSIPCNRCGAVLHVAPSTNYATCAQCGASLAVRRSGDAVYTEPEGEQALRQVAAKLDTIAHQGELARIDQEWQTEREQYLIRGRYGQRMLPSTGMSVVGGVVIVGFGLLWTILAFSITAHLPGDGGSASVFPFSGSSSSSPGWAGPSTATTWPCATSRPTRHTSAAARPS